MGHGCRQVPVGIRRVIDRLRVKTASRAQSQMAGFPEAIAVLRLSRSLQQRACGGKPLFCGGITRCFRLRECAAGLYQRDDECVAGRAMTVFWQPCCARENAATGFDIQQAQRQRIMTVGLEVRRH